MFKRLLNINKQGHEMVRFGEIPVGKTLIAQSEIRIVLWRTTSVFFKERSLKCSPR